MQITLPPPSGDILFLHASICSFILTVYTQEEMIIIINSSSIIIIGTIVYR